MGETKSGTDVFDEYCEECGQTTPHAVHLEIRTEAKGRDDIGHSRTPYRVSKCRSCGTEFTRRMNNV